MILPKSSHTTCPKWTRNRTDKHAKAIPVPTRQAFVAICILKPCSTLLSKIQCGSVVVWSWNTCLLFGCCLDKTVAATASKKETCKHSLKECRNALLSEPFLKISVCKVSLRVQGRPRHIVMQNPWLHGFGLAPQEATGVQQDP